MNAEGYRYSRKGSKGPFALTQIQPERAGGWSVTGWLTADERSMPRYWRKASTVEEARSFGDEWARIHGGAEIERSADHA